jgi:hypothetical protein
MERPIEPNMRPSLADAHLSDTPQPWPIPIEILRKKFDFRRIIRVIEGDGLFSIFE